MANSTNGKQTVTFDNAQHMEAKIQGDRLYISIALEPAGTVSKTGNSFVVATSRGNQATSAIVNNRPVKIGVNAFTGK